MWLSNQIRKIFIETLDERKIKDSYDLQQQQFEINIDNDHKTKAMT